MREHFDHIYSLFDGNQRGIPVLSILILLNDDFQGGDFKINGQSQNMSKGDLIIFPSCFMFPHEVELVTEGTRYSLIAWGY
jgi:predicted 2-oxoglutarate/Fe(II)-dependent dioxygenase YbiX